MNITSAKYTNAKRSVVNINGQYSIPMTPGNRDYDEIVKPYIDAVGAVEDFVPHKEDANEPLREAAIEALLDKTSKAVDSPVAVKTYIEATVMRTK